MGPLPSEREQLKKVSGLFPERQGLNLALAVSYVVYSYIRSTEREREGGRERENYRRLSVRVQGVPGCPITYVRVWCWGLGFGVWVLGFGVWGLGSWVRGLGFGVWGLRFGVWGLGSRVWGSGCQG